MKAVACGLFDVGACQESVLREVFDAIPPGVAAQTELIKGRNAFIRVLATTQPVPTDPVLIDRAFDPSVTRSTLGHAAADVIRLYYNNADIEAPFLYPSKDAESTYDAMAEDVAEARNSGW